MLTLLMTALVVLLVAGMAWMLWGALTGCLMARVWLVCGGFTATAGFVADLAREVVKAVRGE